MVRRLSWRIAFIRAHKDVPNVVMLRLVKTELALMETKNMGLNTMNTFVMNVAQLWIEMRTQ